MTYRFRATQLTIYNVAESERIDIVSWYAIQYKMLSNSGAVALLFRGIWTKISNDLPAQCWLPKVFHWDWAEQNGLYCCTQYN